MAGGVAIESNHGCSLGIIDGIKLGIGNGRLLGAANWSLGVEL
jgi:hypothetical protein